MPAKKQKKNKPKTSKAKKTVRKANKSQGHYCYVCREHKANEKFSGKGHAAHICKACAALTPAERSELIAVNKIEYMPNRYLNESEIKWLRKRLKDPRPEVKEAAQRTHSLMFPRYERNKIKKGLTAHSLEFFIHGEVWSEWGDEIAVNMRVFMENTGELRRIDSQKSDKVYTNQIGA